MASILVVDDRAANRQLLVTLLGYAGHRVLEAADGLEALDLIRTARPDLVITDILMPSMDGFELVERLRRQPDVARLPVVFYTATYRLREARALANSCGVRYVIGKPSEAREILATVAAALGQAPPAAAAVPPAEAERGPLKVLSEKLSQKLAELETVGLRLTAVVDLGLDLASKREPQEILDLVCHGARDLVSARWAVLGLAEAGGLIGELASAGLEPRIAADLARLDTDSWMLRRVLKEGKALVGRASREPAAAALPPPLPPGGSFLAVPLRFRARGPGFILLGQRVGDGGFTPDDRRLAETVAAQATVAYEGALLQDELQRQAVNLRLEVSERRRVEAALRASEGRYRLLFERNLAGVSRGTLDGRLLEINEAYARILGFGSRAELERQGGIERFYDEGAAEELVSEVEATGFVVNRELRLRRADGRPVDVLANVSRVGGEDGEPVVLEKTIMDLTERKLLEEQLRQAMKMEAVGRLAGGVAHDFNNLLTAIVGYAELAESAGDDPARRQESLGEIRRAAGRGAELTRQLLAFSRRQVLQPRRIDLNGLVRDAERLLRRLIGADIELACELAPAPCLVEADPVQVEQVILNLAVNARDAMPGGGRLLLATAEVSVGAEEAAGTAAAAAGRCVRLSVADTGVGMDAETRDHLFEPFFTTKERGKGTGLGLATVYGIVRQSGGFIRVDSAPGEGAAFHVYLPASAGPLETGEPQPAVARPPAAVALPRGAETVLLAEDEEGVRELVRLVLERQGYAVLAAGTGAEALALCRRHEGPLHLLLVDLVMPGMGGQELASEVCALRPAARPLFMSGYSDAEPAPAAGGGSFLEKPFTPETLVRKVREVLDRPPAPPPEP